MLFIVLKLGASLVGALEQGVPVGALGQGVPVPIFEQGARGYGALEQGAPDLGALEQGAPEIGPIFEQGARDLGALGPGVPVLGPMFELGAQVLVRLRTFYEGFFELPGRIFSVPLICNLMLFATFFI